jgi:hypothetical protein
LGDILLCDDENGNRRDASHELRNSLEALVNVLYLIRIDRKDPARVLEWVEMAEIQTKRAEKVLEEELSRQIPLG